MILRLTGAIFQWFYSGGYEFGGTSGYNGFPVVNKSLALDDPVIFVSMNYRCVYSFASVSE